jgi:tetratricopeptide (TPR) repeat protein
VRKLRALLAFACGLAAALPAASALDRVKLYEGGQSSGKLVEMSPTEVVIEVGSTKKKLAVNEIELVQFDGEPNELTQARNALQAGKLEAALALLDKLSPARTERDEVAQDVEFYRALIAARLALAGNGSKVDAGKKLLAFEKANRQSYHYFETCEMLGDLLVALGKNAEAESFYEKVAGAPWPDYQMRAKVLRGKTLVSRKQYAEALRQFDEALAVEGSGSAFERERLAARLGRAAALAGQGESVEAVKLVEEIIDQADVENQQLHAEANLVLGNCFLAAGKKKEALLAFLHVDLLYPRVSLAHAEALAHLAQLWTELNLPERAAQARAALKEKYPQSPWAQP